MGSTYAIVGVVFVFTGLIFFIVGLINQGKVKKAQAWPVASGTVVSTEIKQHKSTQKTGRSGYRTTTTYEPVVNYSYTVGGQPYSGKRLNYGGFQGAELAAQNKIGQYPQGSTVQVHYDPGKPQNSVLEVSADAGKVYWIVGIIFLVIGIAGFLIGIVAG